MRTVASGPRDATLASTTRPSRTAMPALYAGRPRAPCRLYAITAAASMSSGTGPARSAAVRSSVARFSCDAPSHSLPSVYAPTKVHATRVTRPSPPPPPPAAMTSSSSDVTASRAPAAQVTCATPTAVQPPVASRAATSTNTQVVAATDATHSTQPPGTATAYSPSSTQPVLAAGRSTSSLAASAVVAPRTVGTAATAFSNHCATTASSSSTTSRRTAAAAPAPCPSPAAAASSASGLPPSRSMMVSWKDGGWCKKINATQQSRGYSNVTTLLAASAVGSC